nr:reverse transcriptase domain-containing protein [Tanacetum cinerariifolium]
MKTRSVGRLVAESRGKGTGKRVGRGGRGRGPRGAQVGNQGNIGNQNGNVVNENVQENVKNVLANGNRDMSGCSINQKVKYTAGSFVEEFCLSHETQKLKTELGNHAMVRAGHAAYTDRFHELARMILESVEHGPFLWPTVEEDGVTRLKKYSELSAAEAIQA